MRSAVDLATHRALHLVGGDCPKRSVCVDVGPLHRPDVPRPLKQQGRQSKGSARHGVPGIGGDGTQQFAGLDRLKNCRHVLLGVRRERAAQIRRRVALAAAGRNAIAKHLPAELPQIVRHPNGAARLHLAKSVEQERRRHVDQRQRADPREHVLFQAAQPLLRMRRAPSACLRRVQFARHRLERSGAASRPGELVCLACLHGVRAALPCLARLIARRARCLQTDIWVAAQR